MNFLELGLKKDICDIMDSLGYTLPTEVQQNAIPPILFGKDVLVRSETGSGKTFAFVLPILQKIDKNSDDIGALIVCPTRELAIQVADQTKKVADVLDMKVCAVFGGSTIDRQVKSLKKKPQVVIGTTGRILDLIKRRTLKLESANFVVLDEADEMLDMGFLPDIEKIFAHTKKDRQTLMFSATIPDEIKELAKNYQHNSVLIEIGEANKALGTISQNYIFVQKKQKQNLLAELLYSEIYEKCIVFVNTKQFAEELEHLLCKKKLSAKAIHGDMKQAERRRVLDAFREGKIEVLLATDVASRGLDIKDVKYVVNFDLPYETEFYVHRIGRTARAGKSGVVINLITSLEQLSLMRQIEKQTSAKIELYKTNNENILHFYVDTKKLAKENNRFSKKSQTAPQNNKYGFRKQSEDKQKKSRYAIFSTFDDEMFDNFYGDFKQQKNRTKKYKHNQNNKKPISNHNFKEKDNKKEKPSKSKFKDYNKSNQNSNKTYAKTKKPQKSKEKWFSKFAKK